MKTIRKVIFDALNELNIPNLPIGEYLQPSYMAHSPYTTSRRLFVGETTRRYRTCEEYESPLHQKITAFVSFRLDDIFSSSGYVYLDDAYADDNVILCEMSMPHKSDDCTDEQYLSLVEDKLSRILAIQYVRDCMDAKETSNKDPDNMEYLDDI